MKLGSPTPEELPRVMESPSGMMLMAALTGETMTTPKKRINAQQGNERRLFFIEQSPSQNFRQQFMASNKLRNKLASQQRHYQYNNRVRIGNQF
jgi:hypothetical protein